MSTENTHVVPGDTLTLTITGKVVDPALANTADATTMKIYRPVKPGTGRDAPGQVQVDAIFAADAQISYEITSQFKNGVHVDANGRYWMRKPGGWHSMTVAAQPVPSISGHQFTPRSPQRLKEDKD